MSSEPSGIGLFEGMCACIAAAIATLALTVVPAHAKAASPVLEFVAPGHSFPVGFTANGGGVTAELAGFASVVHCKASHGEGEITGPRSAAADYVFTGCTATGGSDDGHKCKSTGAGEEEIKAEAVDAELVFIDQARHEVGMLLNPDGGVYMDFECGGESVDASGPFLSPVGPINQEAMSFTAILSSDGVEQTPNEYENANGEKLPAIPMGKRGSNPLATTGVELGFVIHPDVSLEVRAVTAAEVEAEQREEEAAAAAAKKRRDDEAAAAAAAKKRQEDEALAAAAVTRRLEAEAETARLRRQLLSTALKQCKQAPSKQKRVRCEKRAKKKYGSRLGNKP